MEKKMLIPLFSITLLIATVLIFRASPTGKVVMQEDSFPRVTSPHWTHMPITYSIKNCNNSEVIYNAINKLELETDKSVYFQEADNPDIEISCISLENCYQEKIRKWFLWIITTEVICEHESGTSKITKMKGNKIIKAEIDLVEIPGKEDNCSATELHEILHAFDYGHSEKPGVLMSPESIPGECNDNINAEIIKDLINKYKK